MDSCRKENSAVESCGMDNHVIDIYLYPTPGFSFLQEPLPCGNPHERNALDTSLTVN